MNNPIALTPRMRALFIPSNPLLCSALLFLLSSCTVGPDYVRPSTNIPTKFKEAQGKSFIEINAQQWKLAKPSDDVLRGQWWTVFNDPQLNDFENQLNHYNQSIANAIQTYEQSRAIVDEARASYLPNLTGAFNILRQKSGGGSAPFI